jgi:hypothetical protein
MNKLDQAEALKLRTKQFAIRIVGVARSLPRTRVGDVIGKQLLRCGTAALLIIELFVVPDPRRSLFQKSASWSKKRMRLYSGSSFWRTHQLCRRESFLSCSKKQTNYQLSAQPR